MKLFDIKVIFSYSWLKWRTMGCMFTNTIKWQNIKRNRADIVVKDYKRKTCLLSYISVPTESVKEYYKICNENSSYRK